MPSVTRLDGAEQVTLETVERRRTHLWVVAGAFIVAVSAALAFTYSNDLEPLSVPTIRYAFLGLAAGFLLYVVEQERLLRRLTRALLEAEVLAASLRERVRDLTTLTRVGRLVNSVLTMSEVLEVLLDAVFELTGATRGSVLFLTDNELEVAVSRGQDPAPVGARVPAAAGVVGWVSEHREPLLIDGALDEASYPGRWTARNASGSSICAPLVIDGELIGVMAVERPAGQHPFTEVQLRSVALFAEQAAAAVRNARRFDEERSTAERLADALERRGEFVATLVHELKSPLTAIVGFSAILAKRAEELSADARIDTVEAIRSQARRLSTMVDEVLRVASADAGADLRREEVDLAALARGCADDARAVAVGRDGVARDVIVSAPAALPPVYGDPDALGRVVANLLENAVKYSDPGSPVEVRLAAIPGSVRIDVVDHGRGIPDDQLDGVFERFRQSGGRGAGGVGLGLYIVRSLVSGHGGTVSVTSEEGHGSTFTVELPVRSDDVVALDRGVATTAR